MCTQDLEMRIAQRIHKILHGSDETEEVYGEELYSGDENWDKL
jgi:hypothetical protein